MSPYDDTPSGHERHYDTPIPALVFSAIFLCVVGLICFSFHAGFWYGCATIMATVLGGWLGYKS